MGRVRMPHPVRAGSLQLLGGNRPGRGIAQLLLLSQVVLSLQLPFAVVLLIRFTSRRDVMGAYANPRGVVVLASVIVAVIVAMNVAMVGMALLM
ncbi:divalent metal cation transporter [Cupriavidus sp. TMH.W2]|uniref:divalent metal cation transporter n=1 Tax=Cupriavidus sp. TMH.W2 TaxID=3434465 RepID=UPI003D779191